MLKLSRLNLSPSIAPLIAALVGAIAVGGLAGCGDNKPKTNGGGDGGLCSGSFVSPTDTSTLTIANDLNHSCAGSLHTDVSLATSQADGTSVDLYVGGTKVASATVIGAEVHFLNVQLAQGENTLNAVFSATCSLMAKVTVDCHLPTCNITKPVLSATHTALNGVAAAMSGDRVSAVGSPYQAEFDVVTDVEDGQPVQLKITTGTASSSTTIVQGTAVSGKTTFPGVTLVPDGNYTIEADCTNKVGVLGQSTKGTYPVDSTAPVLSISSPSNGKFFGPTELTNGAFQVCAQTPDKDATALPAALGDAVKNLSVAVGTGSPDPTNGYTAVTATGTDTCINVMCTSSTPIDLIVTLKDAAGNPTVKTISQIACATMLPGVQIVSPPSDATPFNDTTKHLLATTSTNTLRDQDSVTPGAQWTVVACADKSGSATLFGGAMGGNLTTIAGPVNTVTAAPGDNCPNGYSQVARFPGVTLPDSQEDTDGSLLSATELRVDVLTPSSATGSSPTVDMWVDSSAPNIQQSIPNNLCGLVHQSTTDWTTAIRLLSTSPTVTMTVTNGGTSTDYPPTTWVNGFANFASVALPLGVNQVTATATDLAGNPGALMSPCIVTVGTPPIVTFVKPLATNTLCASVSTSGTCIPDRDNVAPGWQGDLDVTVSVSGDPNPTGMVDFTVGTTDLGTVAIDGSGHARLTGVTIPDGKAVVLTAATSDIGGNGIGVTTETLIVDTVVPDPVASVSAIVKDRRQTSFHLTWTAPADGGQRLFSYIVKVSKGAFIDGDWASFNAATTISYTGSPVAPTAPDSIDATGLTIENPYYFAVAPVDAAGNRGMFAATGATTAHFKMNILSPPSGSVTGELFGGAMDGVADLNNDKMSDLLVGTLLGQRVYIYNGSTDFGSTTMPTTIINGPQGVGFGRQFIDVGDIDHDGMDDYAISSPASVNGKIYIFKGRVSWHGSYNADSEADYILDLGAAYNGKSLGASMTRLGDFNGDGVDDFAVGAYGFNGSQGRVVIILGRAGFSAATLSVHTIDGDPAYPAGTFGGAVLGLGRLYINTTGTTLVVAANNAGALTRGRVYAFHGITGTGAALNATSADNFVEGPVDNGGYGTSIGLVGGLAGVPGVAITTGRASSFGNGFVDVHYGSTIAGPFSASPVRFNDSLATVSSDVFGRVVAGCAFAGTSTTVTLIGDSKPDLLMAPYTESNGGPSQVYIVDGSRLSTITSPANVVTNADVVLPLPSDWKSLPLQRNVMIKDLDNDGYGDFAIGENVSMGFARLAVFW